MSARGKVMLGSEPFEPAKLLAPQTRSVGPRALRASRRRRAEAFGELFSGRYDVTGDWESFYGSQSSIALESMAVIRFSYAGMAYRRTAEHVRRSPEERVILQINERGGGVGDYGGSDYRMGPGDAALVDLSKLGGHRTMEHNGGMLISMSREVARPFMPASGQVMVRSGPRARLLSGFARWLHAGLPNVGPAAIAPTERAIRTVIAACFDPDTRLEPEGREVLGRMAMTRALSFIETRCMEPLGVEEVAAAALVSRATLYRLFKPLGGVAEQIWRARLTRAGALLNDPNTPGSIGEVADLCGFTTAQHFSQRFKAEYGFSPRNLRPF